MSRPRAREDSTWYDVTFLEMKAFLAINILMGINRLPRLEMYWSSNSLIGNSRVASIMTCNRFRKILQYFHVADKEMEPARDTPEYRLCKVQPVIDVVADTFQTSYTLSQEVSVDEAMIPFRGRLAYRQYMPAKPVKRGIKVWALCDARNGYMSKFDIYLGRQNNTTEHGLGYNVVTRLTDYLQGTRRMLFFDNFFTGVQLMKDLLAKGLYACGTVRACRKGFPPALKKPATVRNRGDFKILQLGDSNLVATVWKDKKLVYHLSTVSDPTRVMDARRRCGPAVLNLRQPRTVHQYNQFMGGVDLNDQLRMKYDVGRNGKKAWRYIFWFLLNSAIVNAYILFQTASRRMNKKKRFCHLDFRMELIEELIGGFTKRKRTPLNEMGEAGVLVDQENLQGHVSTRMPGDHKTCKYHTRVLKKRKETVYGCTTCNVHLCKDGCHAKFHGL